MDISKKELKNLVKELISERAKEIKESDLVFKKKSDWIEAKKDLRKDLVELLKHIESDDYKEGVSKIDEVITSLKGWKDKINKKLVDEGSSVEGSK